MPQIYGIEHIIYLIITISMMVVATLLIKKYVHTEQQLTFVIKIIGGLLLVAILWNRWSVSYYRSGFNAFLPGSFCGASSLFFALSTLFLKKNQAPFHCLIYIGMLGGLITIVYPDFIGQADSVLYPPTISGLLHHTIMFYLAVLMIITGYVKPNLKKWHYLPLGLSLYMTYGLFLVTVLGYGDAMLIYSPILEGTPLNWIVCGAMMLCLHFLFLLGWNRYQRKIPLLLDLIIT